jgi:hypothetical protein
VDFDHTGRTGEAHRSDRSDETCQFFVRTQRSASLFRLISSHTILFIVPAEHYSFYQPNNCTLDVNSTCSAPAPMPTRLLDGGSQTNRHRMRRHLCVASLFLL